VQDCFIKNIYLIFLKLCIIMQKKLKIVSYVLFSMRPGWWHLKRQNISGQGELISRNSDSTVITNSATHYKGVQLNIKAYMLLLEAHLTESGVNTYNRALQDINFELTKYLSAFSTTRSECERWCACLITWGVRIRVYQAILFSVTDSFLEHSLSSMSMSPIFKNKKGHPW
jgi:hypothetical protein